MTKLCECGCGTPAPIAPRSYWKLGYVRGEPIRYCLGHNNNHWKAKRVPRVCLNCQTAFTIDASRLTSGRGVYCSAACRYAHYEQPNLTRLAKVCLNCKTEFTLPPSHMKLKGAGKYCSRACRDQHRRGVAHPAFRASRGHNRGVMWYTVRRQILVRDRYCCLDCGMSQEAHLNRYKKGLGVHHLLPYRFFSSESLANDPTNLITVCESCHRVRDQEADVLEAVSILEAIGQQYEE